MTMELPFRIALSDPSGESRLFRDYTSDPGSVIRSVLGGYERSDPAWERELGRSRVSGKTEYGRGRTWDALVDGLVSYNAGLGVDPNILGKLEAARRGDVRFVVTGQQPGALGGALLTWYKVATAGALARHLEAAYGTPCVPLYWMGADDVDFQEIREFHVMGCDLAPVAASLPGTAHEAASAVGEIATGEIRKLWESVEPIVRACRGGALASSVVESAFDGARDHGEVTARIICAITGRRVAIVDGREGAVREHARDLFLAFFDRETSVRDEIAAGGERLLAAGYHAQISLGPDSGVFLLEDGRRRKIVPERRAQARELMSASVREFGPGVVLRNLVQDFVFRPVAAVLGPAEIAYRAQMRGVYGLLSVGTTVAFPRMQATFLPPQLADVLRSLASTDIARLVADPSAFVGDVYHACASPALETAVAEFRGSFREGAARFVRAVESSVDGKTAEKLKKRLADVERRLEQSSDVAGEAGKSAALSRWPFLEVVPESLRLKDKPQERYLSLLAPILSGGEAAMETVAGAAEAFTQGALDGCLCHIVYSA
jgi:hypothetical protein